MGLVNNGLHQLLSDIRHSIMKVLYITIRSTKLYYCSTQIQFQHIRIVRIRLFSPFLSQIMAESEILWLISCLTSFPHQSLRLSPPLQWAGWEAWPGVSASSSKGPPWTAPPPEWTLSDGRDCSPGSHASLAVAENRSTPLEWVDVEESLKPPCPHPTDLLIAQLYSYNYIIPQHSVSIFSFNRIN